MRFSFYLVILFTLVFGSLPAVAAEHAQHAALQANKLHAQQSVTQGSVTVEGKRINYGAIAGIAIINNNKRQPYTSMSYVAYIKKGVNNESNRPITFFYNGGPGSSTVYLHMLAWGPKLVVVGNGTLTPPAPYSLVNNSDSLLDATDEVFIDAPGTGFGRIITKKESGVGTPKMVYGVDGDARTFARFIRQYLTVHSRWNSPKFLYGESYGTTRDAVLAYDLERSGIGLNGVVFQSCILDFDFYLRFPQLDPGNNLSYALGLPTYAATAWYHKKLPNQPKALKPFLHDVKLFAMGPYLDALNKGNLLKVAVKQKIAEQVHRYTGLPISYILKANLRVNGGEFRHKLLSKTDRITGRDDSRYIGLAMNPLAGSASSFGSYDPSNSSISPPLVAMFSQYMHKTLKFGTDMFYRFGNLSATEQWNYTNQSPGASMSYHLLLPAMALNVLPDLSTAMKLNPDLKIMLVGGYFDFATPFYAAEYEMHQLQIPASLQKNISYHFFPSGHMLYLNPKVHKALHNATSTFIKASEK